MKPIFIIGQARTGSTLLMRMLNASQGVRIYGESDGVSNYVYKLYLGLYKGGINACCGGVSEQESEKLLSDHGHWQARCACYQPASFEQPIRDILGALMHPYGDRGLRYGFKEVIAGSEIGYMAMLLDLYPEAKIIHTMRHPREFLLSLKRLKWMKSSPEVHLDNWRHRQGLFLESVARWPDRVALVAYEEMTEPVLRLLWRWLEVDFGEGTLAALSQRVYAAGRPEIQLDEEEERQVQLALERQALYPLSSQSASLSRVPGLRARGL